MKVTILGSGTYFPELKRHSSSYLIRTENQNLVFDFGRGALDQLLKVGVSYEEVDALFVSHTHADHCSELSSLLHISLAEPPRFKLRNKNLNIFGPPGIEETISYLLKAFHLQDLEPEYQVHVHTLRDGERKTGKGWKVQAFKTNHLPLLYSLSFRLEAQGKVFAYSGDTVDCPGVRKACQSADLAIIEASVPQELYTGESGHLTAKVTGQIAKECGVKKLVLTHVSPYYLKDFEVKKEAEKAYKGEVLIAKDLMKVTI